MGWSFVNSWKNATDVCMAVSHETLGGGKVREVDCARTRESGYIVRWTLLEALVDVSESFPAGRRIITCDLIQRDRDADCWGYKGMDETMGPFYLSCPMRLINKADKAGPALNTTAAAWRSKVRAFNADKTIAKQATRSWFYTGGQAYLTNCAATELNGQPVTILSVRPLIVSWSGSRVRVRRTQLSGTPSHDSK